METGFEPVRVTKFRSLTRAFVACFVRLPSRKWNLKRESFRHSIKIFSGKGRIRTSTLVGRNQTALFHYPVELPSPFKKGRMFWIPTFPHLAIMKKTGPAF